MAVARFSEPGDVQAISLSVIAFPGASNWPLWVGQQKGFFAGQGLKISLSITPNSVHMARELYTGGAHVALTSMDNVVAYGRGEGEVSLGEPADFFAVMRVDDRICARPQGNSRSPWAGGVRRALRVGRNGRGTIRRAQGGPMCGNTAERATLSGSRIGRKDPTRP